MTITIFLFGACLLVICSAGLAAHPDRDLEAIEELLRLSDPVISETRVLDATTQQARKED